jgi:hypothetical protein
VTDFGLCCTFNLLPDVLNKTAKEANTWWDLEEGYSSKHDRSVANNPHMQEKPYRTDIAGISGGITFSLDAQVKTGAGRPKIDLTTQFLPKLVDNIKNVEVYIKICSIL